MKTKVLYLSSLLMTALAVTGCFHYSSGPKPSKNKITKKYSIDAFNKIETQAPVNIVFTQGTSSTVEAEGPDNYIAHLTVVTKDSTLYIGMDKKSFTKIKSNRIHISISSPDLCSIKQRGTGSITLRDSVKVENLSIICDGVGSIKSDALMAQNVYVAHKGVGSIELEGEARNAKYYLDGVGSLKAKNMIVSDVLVEQNGVGSVSCYASGTINISTQGVGSVNYYGKPQVTGLKKSGVGSVNSK